MQPADLPELNAPMTAGMAREAKMAIILMTTKSSIRVKAFWRGGLRCLKCIDVQIYTTQRVEQQKILSLVGHPRKFLKAIIISRTTLLFSFLSLGSLPKSSAGGKEGSGFDRDWAKVGELAGKRVSMP